MIASSLLAGDVLADGSLLLSLKVTRVNCRRQKHMMIIFHQINPLIYGVLKELA